MMMQDRVALNRRSEGYMLCGEVDVGLGGNCNVLEVTEFLPEVRYRRQNEIDEDGEWG